VVYDIKATYVRCKVASILHKIGIYSGWMGHLGKQIVSPIDINLANYNHMQTFFCYIKVSSGK
jgi:hypothetical protein